MLQGVLKWEFAFAFLVVLIILAGVGSSCQREGVQLVGDQSFC